MSQRFPWAMYVAVSFACCPGALGCMESPSGSDFAATTSSVPSAAVKAGVSPPPEEDIKAICQHTCEQRPAKACDISVANCVSMCLTHADFGDNACQACTARTATWPPSGCNDWECTCSPPIFPGIFWPDCADACATSIERTHQALLAQSAPHSVGHLPIAQTVLEHPGAARSEGATLSEVVPGIAALTDRVWLCTRQGELMELGAEVPLRTLTQVASSERCALARGAAGRVFAATKEWRAGAGTEVDVLSALDPSGDVHFREDLWDWPDVLLPTPDDGLVMFRGYSAARLVVVDESGNLRGDTSVDLPYDQLDLRPVALRVGNSYVLAGSYGDAQTEILVALALQDTSNGAEAQLAWSRTLERSDAKVRAYALGATRSGEIIVAGDHADLGTGAGRSTQTWLAKLSSDGTQTLWEWIADDSTGAAAAVAVGSDDSIYVAAVEALSMEATAALGTADPQCAPEGCTTLSLRKFDAQGRLQWRYLHREAAAAGPSVALSDDGRIYVAALLGGSFGHGIEGRPRVPVVMVFDP